MNFSRINAGLAPRVRLTVIGGLLVALTLGLACLTIWNLRQNAIARAMQTADNMGVLLADQNERLVQAVNLLAQEAGDMALASGARTPDQFAALMASQNVHDYLVDHLHNLPQADAISLLDQHGFDVNSSRDWPVRRFDVSGRDYFKALREQNLQGLFVGDPFRNLTNGIGTSRSRDALTVRTASFSGSST
jgi:hypothetical protein